MIAPLFLLYNSWNFVKTYFNTTTTNIFYQFKKNSFLFSPRCNINILRFVNKDWSRDQQGQVIGCTGKYWGVRQYQFRILPSSATWTPPQRAIILREKMPKNNFVKVIWEVWFPYQFMKKKMYFFKISISSFLY